MGYKLFNQDKSSLVGLWKGMGEKRCVLSEGNLRLMRRVAIDVLGKIKGMGAFAYHEVVVG